MFSKKLIVYLGIIGLMLSSPTMVLGGNNPTVLPPNAKPRGWTQSERAAEFFKLVSTTPASENPITGSTGNHCVVKMAGNIGLVLTNPASSEPYCCSVSPGTMLITPVGGIFCDTLSWPFPQNEAELEECLSTFSPTTNVGAWIDEVEIENLADHLVRSLLYTFTLPDVNIYGLPPGTSGQGMGQIHLLIVTPLTRGEHTFHFHSTYPKLGGYTDDFTIQITVEP